MERQTFEDAIKKAFEQAEFEPSEKAWINIELELEKAQGWHLKSSIQFYKMLAAASVVFAIGVGGLGIYLFNQERATEQRLMALMQEMETVQQEKVAGITNPPAEVPPADVKNSVSGSGGNGATPNNNEVALAGAAPQ